MSSEEWQVSGNGTFLDFFPESFGSSNKISNIKLHPSSSDSVEFMHELLFYLDFSGITGGRKFPRPRSIEAQLWDRQADSEDSSICFRLLKGS